MQLCFIYERDLDGETWEFSFLFFKPFFIFFSCTLWHVGSSSLTGDQTQAPCTRNPESSPQDHQKSPHGKFSKSKFSILVL